MKNLLKLKIGLLILVSSFILPISAITLIHAGSLFDGTGSKVSTEMSIFIENEYILKVEKGYISPGVNDKYIDLSDSFVLPGLIDMHVHLSNEYSAKSYQESISLNAAD